jgi:hypothetical protein
MDASGDEKGEQSQFMVAIEVEKKVGTLTSPVLPLSHKSCSLSFSIMQYVRKTKHRQMLELLLDAV